MKWGWYVVYGMMIIANDCIMWSRTGAWDVWEIFVLGFGPILCFLAGKYMYKGKG